MHPHLRSLAIGLLALAAVVANAPTAHAQGTTTSAINGTVTAEGGAPVAGAEVQLVNPDTGDLFTATTNAAGKYFLDNVPPGGPYILTASASGFEPGGLGNVMVNLDQRLSLDLGLKAGKVEEIVIYERIDQLQDRSRTGPSSVVRDTAISRLPLLGRNFTDLIQTSPQYAAGSIAGQNNRFNNIQIDGGPNNDLFGLAASGTPGGQANAKPISVEAIQEFVVQVAPFDVRQGSFTGGLVNAITKSGTNDFRGNLFAYLQNKSLGGFTDSRVSELKGTPFVDFTTWQFGANLGGPIIKDKLHFFVSGDFQQRESAFASPFQISGTDSAADIAKVGFDNSTVQRFIDILASKGVTNVGNALAPDQSNPDRNVFAKVSTNVIKNSRLELSYNFVKASQDILGRGSPTNPRLPTSTTSLTPSLTSLRDGYQLSNSGYAIANTTNTGRLKLGSVFEGGKWSNEFLAGFSIIRDLRDIPNNIPLVLVKAGKIAAADSWLAAGGERFSQANSLDQNIYTLQDSVTYGGGENHRLTFGTSNEFLGIRNVFLQAATGVWAFNSLDDLEANMPAAYTRYIRASDKQEPGTAEFSVAQIGFYLQDEWSLEKHVTITPGLRIDIPFLGSAPTNDFLANNRAFPVDTSKVPSGNALWSPRIGFNWDVEGDANTIVRGGAGIFTGRPPYVWVSNAYANNGMTSYPLSCYGATGVPAFTLDPNNQPTTCGTTPPTLTRVAEVDYFDPNTKYPQNLRFALGADRRLPWDITASVDFLYTQDVNGWYTTDANLKHIGVSSEGRALYGTFGASGFSPSPSRIDPVNIGNAVIVYNKTGGRVYDLTFQVQKLIGRWLDTSLAYTYGDSADRMSLTSSQAFSNLQFAPLDGTLEDRNVRPSAFDVRHKLTLTATAALPLGFGLGLSYIGRSGLPYVWTVNGDVNADGMSSNDQVYVPKTKDDISLDKPETWDGDLGLNAFIDSQECLKKNRGHIIKRGDCRNDWQHFVNLRASWATPKLLGQRIEVQLDIFNLMNLINPDWGQFNQAAGFENGPPAFLRAVGYDQLNNRPIYSFAAPLNADMSNFQVNKVQANSSTSYWRIQLGARYAF